MQIDELGGNVFIMYHFIGGINDTKVLALGSLLIHVNENFFSKDEPPINEHHSHITRKRFNQALPHMFTKSTKVNLTK